MSIISQSPVVAFNCRNYLSEYNLNHYLQSPSIEVLFANLSVFKLKPMRVCDHSSEATSCLCVSSCNKHVLITSQLAAYVGVKRPRRVGQLFEALKVYDSFPAN